MGYVKKGYPRRNKFTIKNKETMERATIYEEELIKYFLQNLFDKECAKDLVQLTYIRASRRVSHDDGSGDFKKKLFNVARDVLHTHFKKEGKNIFHPYNVVYFEENSEIYSPTEEDVFLLWESIKKQLHTKEKEILNLLLEGYTIEEIKSKMGYKSKNAVSVMKSRLIVKIRKILKGMGYIVKK